MFEGKEKDLALELKKFQIGIKNEYRKRDQ